MGTDSGYGSRTRWAPIGAIICGYEVAGPRESGVDG